MSHVLKQLQEANQCADEIATSLRLTRADFDKDLNGSNQKSSKEYFVEISQMERDIAQKEQEMGGTIPELTAAFNEAERNHNAAVNEVARAKNNLIDLREAMQLREDTLQELRNASAERADKFFTKYLGVQRHNGRLIFNHETKALRLEVHAAGSLIEDSNKVTDNKGLSGGERSYSTLSFVLALGQSMCVPFRALDEFDVFMDSVNRRVSIDLLLSVAKAHRSQQFIYITPQDVSHIRPSPDLRIHKLVAPVRGQQELEWNAASSSRSSSNDG
jgi:chromosome segregation ATPase